MPTARVDDISIYYEVHGVGEPLLLIGGLGADLTLFAGLIGWLAPRYQVVAFDIAASAGPTSRTPRTRSS